MNKNKLQEIISRLNRFRTLNDSDVEEAVLWLNAALILIEEQGSNLPRAKDTRDSPIQKLTLTEFRNMVGISQQAHAERMRELGRGNGFQGAIMQMERSYNSPTVSRLNDYLEALGFTLEMIASNDSGSYLMDVGALTRSRAKDARKKDSEV